MYRVILSVVTSFCAAATICTPAVGKTDPRYHVSKAIAGPDGLWDYASVDGPARRLYIGQKGGLLSLDLASPHAKPTILYKSIVIHQALPLGGGRLIATGGPSNRAYILDGKSGTLLASIPTGQDTDAVAYDMKTRRAVTFNRGDKTATVIDIDRASVVATIALPSEAEFPVGDGNGLIYVNLAHHIAVIDVAQALIARQYSLAGCEGPTGLALDKKAQILISACSNGRADFVTTSGQPIARLTVGRDPDAAFVDKKTRLVFIPSGKDGTLSIISLANPKSPKVIQTLKTKVEARTGAVDPVTGIIYLPVGKLLPPAAAEKWPTTAAGTFEIMVIKPSLRN